MIDLRFHQHLKVNNLQTGSPWHKAIDALKFLRSIKPQSVLLYPHSSSTILPIQDHNILPPLFSPWTEVEASSVGLSNRTTMFMLSINGPSCIASSKISTLVGLYFSSLLWMLVLCGVSSIFPSTKVLGGRLEVENEWSELMVMVAQIVGAGGGVAGPKDLFGIHKTSKCRWNSNCNITG